MPRFHWLILLTMACALAACRGGVRGDQANVRFEVFPPTSAALGGFQLSPDGRHIVVATKNRLWIRPLTSLRFEVMAGTEGARLPFWSPDSQSIAFFADGTLKRIAVGGGVPTEICPVLDPRGGSWSRDDVIAFAARGTSSGLFRVSAGGGRAVRVAPFPDDSTGALSFPEFLPDGSHLLILREASSDSVSGVYVVSIDGQAAVRVIENRSSVALAAGQVLFRREGALVAQPFDVMTRRLSGEPRVVAEAVDETADGQVAVSGSAAGAIVFRNRPQPASEQLEWVDGTGRVLGAIGRPGRVFAARVSPDMQRLAFVSGDGPDLWLQDLPNGPVTHAGGGPVSSGVAWAPASDRVAIGLAGPPASLVIRQGHPPHVDTPFPTTGFGLTITDWSADGRWIVFEQDGGPKKVDLWLLPLLAQGTPTPVAYTEGSESDAAFSPDGQWLAYVRSDAEGPNVFVQSVPVPRTVLRVSQRGGVAPRWRPDGGELYFQALDDMLMSVGITFGPSPAIGATRALFDLGAGRFLQATPEGRRFLIVARQGEDMPLTLIRNWSPDTR